jgi:hypothetical protein
MCHDGRLAVLVQVETDTKTVKGNLHVPPSRKKMSHQQIYIGGFNSRDTGTGKLLSEIIIYHPSALAGDIFRSDTTFRTIGTVVPVHLVYSTYTPPQNSGQDFHLRK